MWKRQKTKSEPAPKEFRQLYPYPNCRRRADGVIWEGYGIFPSAPTLAHSLRCREIAPSQGLLQGDRMRTTLLGKFASGFDRIDLLAVERRGQDRVLLQHFLAINTPVTHVFEFSYEFLKQPGQFQPIFKGAVSLAIPAHDANAIAQACCRFIARIAKEVPPDTEESLALRRVDLRSEIFWLTAIYKYWKSDAIALVK